MQPEFEESKYATILTYPGSLAPLITTLQCCLLNTPDTATSGPGSISLPPQAAQYYETWSPVRIDSASSSENEGWQQILAEESRQQTEQLLTAINRENTTFLC
jgi:hypothetical protein